MSEKHWMARQHPGVRLSSAALIDSARLYLSSDRIQIHQRRPISSFAHELANQLDRPKLRIHRRKTGRMRQKIEHRALFNRPLDTQPNRFQKMFQLPAAITK